MSTFERYLTIWVFLCIVAGMALGHFMPGLFQIVGATEIAKVNIPVAILIWLMIIPMLLKIDFRSLAQVGTYWRGIGVTLIINWAVKPFSMAACRPDRLLYCRPDHPGRGALHGHGVRLEQPDAR